MLPFLGLAGSLGILGLSRCGWFLRRRLLLVGFGLSSGCGRGVAGALLSVAEFVSGLGSAWGATFFGLGWLPDSGAALRVLRLCWFPAAPAIN